jgi:hypothetical protein
MVALTRPPTRQSQNAIAKFVVTLVQAQHSRLTLCLVRESATVGSVSMLWSRCYWLVLLMRRLTLVAEGSSRGGSSLQTEVLLLQIAITA